MWGGGGRLRRGLFASNWISSLSPLPQKQRVASFYKSKANQSELDRSLLSVVPDAPRIPQIAANEFDWNVINPDQVQKFPREEIKMGSRRDGAET